MLPMISNADVGRPTIPGEYACNGALVMVEAKHIATWAADSEALISTVLCTRMGDRGPVRYALGQAKVI